MLEYTSTVCGLFLGREGSDEYTTISAFPSRHADDGPTTTFLGRSLEVERWNLRRWLFCIFRDLLSPAC